LFFSVFGHFVVPALFVLVALGLVPSVLSQEIGWEGHLQNDQFCVKAVENDNLCSPVSVKSGSIVTKEILTNLSK